MEKKLSSQLTHQIWIPVTYSCGDAFKDKIYWSNPRTILELEATIETEFKSSSNATLNLTKFNLKGSNWWPRCKADPSRTMSYKTEKCLLTPIRVAKLNLFNKMLYQKIQVKFMFGHLHDMVMKVDFMQFMKICFRYSTGGFQREEM